MAKPDINERIAVGDEAARLLAEGSLFNAIISSVTKDYIVTLMRTVPGSPEGLSAHAGLNALNNIKEAFKAIQNDGVMAKKEAEKNNR